MSMPLVPEQSRSDRDRRVRQADRLARILTVLRLIQSRGQWNAKAIAQELEVTERTVYRDLQALEFAGVPWYYDSEAESYRVRSDYRFPVPNLTEDEIIGQAVASAITKAPGLDIAGGASSTTQKIAAASGEDVKQLLADTEQIVSVLGLQFADHRGQHDVIRKLQQALIQRKQIKGSYSSPYEDNTVSLDLNPIRLCLIKNAWYLVGTPVDADEPRTYRVARFHTLEVCDAPADIPEDFDIRAYFGNAWAVYRGSETFDIRVRFLSDAARIVTETQWHATQEVEENDDGSVVLSFQIDGLEEICNWLLAWAGRAEALEPPQLRAMVVEKLKAGLELNQ
jgi:predicted DNA-binding transcriptional regulator YafY